MTFDSKLTTGNLITIGTLVVGLIASAVTYKNDIKRQGERLDMLEAQMKILQTRVELVESTTDKDRLAIERMQNDLNRSVKYLELLLDKENIQYIN